MYCKKLVLFLFLLFIHARVVAEWSDPVTLYTSSTLPDSTGSLAINESGFSALAWADTTLFANVKEVLQNWEAAQNEDFQFASNEEPVVGIDGNSTTFIFYTVEVSGDYLIRYVSKELNGAWTAPALLHNNGPSEPKYSRVAASPNGNLLFVWTTPDALFCVFKSSQNPSFGAVNQTPVSNQTSSFNTSSAVDNAGNGLIVWQSPTANPSIKEVLAARVVAGTIQAPTSISVPDENCENPRVALSGSGLGVAVWFNATNQILQSLDYSIVWNNLQTIPSGSGDFFFNDNVTDLAIDDIGNCVFTFTLEEIIGLTTRASYRPIGQSWTTSSVISDPTYVSAPFGAALDGEGIAIVAFVEIDSQQQQFQIRSGVYIPSNSEWQMSTIVGLSDGSPGRSSFAMDSSGNGSLSYLRALNGSKSLNAMAGQNVQKPLEPGKFAGAGAFAITIGYKGIVNKLTWRAPLFPTPVAYYVIYRAGQQIGTTSDLEYYDAGILYNTSFTYQIQAIFIDGTASSLVATTVGGTT